jgi:D-alanine transaminase
MPELVWLNGRVLPLGETHISIDDRGFHFADGVYEVIRIYGGRMFALHEHLDRLQRSCEGLRISMPLPAEHLTQEIEALLRQSDVSEGAVYLQLTRGVARRTHLCPPDIKPTLLFYIRPQPPIPPPGEGDGLKLWSVPDERWRKCWIKSTALAANVLAKLEAADHGADEALFVLGDIVTECASSNLFAVIGGTLVTHPAGPHVLPGITRGIVLDCARELDLPVFERPLTLTEARAADEMFITGTTREIVWVSTWDDHPISPGRCGPITTQLHRRFIEHRRSQTS